MLTERNHAVLLLDSPATADRGVVPEITVSAADAPSGGKRRDEAKADAADAPAPRAATGAARVARAFVAYGLAGFIGWTLYDLAAPLHRAWSNVARRELALPELSLPDLGLSDLGWPDLFGARERREQAELLRLTQTLSAQVQTLQTKIDALEKARSQEGSETRNAPLVEELSRRLDETKTGLGADIGALSAQIKDIREAEARRAETRAAAERLEKPIAAEAGASRRSPTVAAHVEPGWKRARRRGDAFDPSLHPTAPGAPRPLTRAPAFDR
jgi:hypothetical protein